jgi:hypothetical protein
MRGQYQDELLAYMQATKDKTTPCDAGRPAGYATPYCLNQASIRAQASLAASAR